MTWSRIHSAPLRVLPKPRPASSSQVRQSPFGARWLGRPHQPQSCSIVSSSRSLVCLRNAASFSGGSDASNSAHETFSDSANLDLDRITVRDTGVFVGAGFAPAAARLHPEDRGSDAGALVFESRVAHPPCRAPPGAPPSPPPEHRANGVRVPPDWGMPCSAPPGLLDFHHVFDRADG